MIKLCGGHNFSILRDAKLQRFIAETSDFFIIFHRVEECQVQKLRFLESPAILGIF